MNLEKIANDETLTHESPEFTEYLRAIGPTLEWVGDGLGSARAEFMYAGTPHTVIFEVTDQDSALRFEIAYTSALGDGTTATLGANHADNSSRVACLVPCEQWPTQICGGKRDRSVREVPSAFADVINRYVLWLIQSEIDEETPLERTTAPWEVERKWALSAQQLPHDEAWARYQEERAAVA